MDVFEWVIFATLTATALVVLYLILAGVIGLMHDMRHRRRGREAPSSRPRRIHATYGPGYEGLAEGEE